MDLRKANKKKKDLEKTLKKQVKITSMGQKT